MRKYAQDTSVPVGRSQEAIRQLVLDRGADGWMVGEDRGRAVISFRLQDRLLRFHVQLPEKLDAKEERRLWRALYMAIKAKLVIASEGIETFDEVFLANIVTPDGSTVGDRIIPDVQMMLESGQAKVLRLLPERTR